MKLPELVEKYEISKRDNTYVLLDKESGKTLEAQCGIIEVAYILQQLAEKVIEERIPLSEVEGALEKLVRELRGEVYVELEVEVSRKSASIWYVEEDGIYVPLWKSRRAISSGEEASTSYRVTRYIVKVRVGEVLLRYVKEGLDRFWEAYVVEGENRLSHVNVYVSADGHGLVRFPDGRVRNIVVSVQSP